MTRCFLLPSLAALALLAACGREPEAAAPPPIEEPAPDPALSSPYAAAALAFVNQIYAGYAVGQPPLLPGLASPDLHLILQNIEFLPADPFCDCQDYQGLSHQARVVSVDNRQAAVAVQVSGYGPPKVMTLHLVMTPLGWRLDDVRGPGDRSIRSGGVTGAPMGGAYRPWGADMDPNALESSDQGMDGSGLGY